MNRRLFTPLALGRTTLQNRVVMAPMTRSRAIGNVPNDLMAAYYGQRRNVGLTITEATSSSPNGLGYARIPGLFNRAQVDGWRKVTHAVHGNGGRIFVQLFHTGRISHPENLPAGAEVLAPSAVAAVGQVHTDSQGPQPFPVPKEMSEADIEQAIEEFVTASKLAVEAGFDGVELHGANGYLIDQFLNRTSNRRNDRWGGNAIDNRLRFAVETARRVGEAIGVDRVGLRISPFGTFNDVQPDPDMEKLYERLAEELSDLGLAYLHVIDQSGNGFARKIRTKFNGTLILSGGYDVDRAEHDIMKGYADLIAFGKPFISNPDLVAKLKEGRPLRPFDPATFYTPGEKGYLDYA